MRRAASVAFYVVVVAVGAVLVAWAFAGAWGWPRQAPREFWLLAILAVVSDGRALVRRKEPRETVGAMLSVCFTFAIFLLWGVELAIAVQFVAAVVSAVPRRPPVRAWAFHTARLVCAFGAAEVTAIVAGRADTAIGTGIDRLDLIPILLPALAWFVVSFALLILARAIAGLGVLRGIVVSLRYDMLATVALLSLAPVLVTAPTGWSIALIIVPLLALIQFARLFGEQERRLSLDPATGVLSARGLVERIDRLTAADAAEPTRQRPFAVMLIYLEGLGYITRSLGRGLGERAVAEGARRLTAIVGERDRLGRLVGEGFVVLWPGPVEGDAQASLVDTAASIARLLSAPVEVDGLPFALMPTVGIAVSPEHGRDLSTLVAKAETAVAEARARDEAVRVYAPEEQSMTERRMAVLAELASALQDPARRSEIAFVYQPQVDIGSGRVVGVEALLRWTHPRWGPMPTDELIRTTEPSELMHLLTRRVTDDVISQLAAWNEAGVALRAAVNVSARDLGSEGFDEQLVATLAEHGVRPDQLEIEITEGTLIADSARLVQATRRLVAMGIGLSLDDFGTGFASLQQLRRFPLTEVKIDRTYVSRMASSSAERAIVRAIHELARALDLRIVAEGVEDGETAALLASLPGIIGQGWYFARPMAADDLMDWLRTHDGVASSRSQRRGSAP